MSKRKPSTNRTVMVVLQNGDEFGVICKGKRLNISIPEFELYEGDDPYKVASIEYKKQLGHDIVNLIFKGIITTTGKNGEIKNTLILKGTEFYTRPITSPKPEDFKWIKRERLHRYSRGKLVEDIVNNIDAPCASYTYDQKSGELRKIEELSMVSEIVGHEMFDCEDVIRFSFLTLCETFAFSRENFSNFIGFVISKYVIKWFADNGYHLFGYFDNGHLIGCTFVFCNCINQMMIRFLCTLPDYRHMKVGKSILEHCIKYAKSRNCSVIRAEVMFENTRLKNFFMEHGFEIEMISKPSNYPFLLAHMKLKLDK